MKPVWRLLLRLLEAHEDRGGALTETERHTLAWLRAWRRREWEEQQWPRSATG